VSNTALWVAAIRAIESKKENPLFVDPFAEALIGKEGYQIMEYYESFNEDKYWISKKDQTEFQHTLIGIRVRWFDEMVIRELKKQNMTEKQVVILASGLDMRAYRLDFPSNTSIYEVDLPEIVEWKQKKVQEIGAVPKCANLISVSSDLSKESWLGDLESKGFKKDLATIWIVEGLVIYLDADSVKRLLSNIARISPPGSVLALDVGNSCLTTGDWKQLDALKQQGNPMKFGMDYPERYMKSCGWNDVVAHQLGDKNANFGRYKMGTMPRWIPSPFARYYLVTARK